MKHGGKISAGQLFLLAFIARVIITLAYGINAGGHTISNADWLACLALPIPLLLLGIPTFLLLRQSKGTSLCDYCYTLGKPLGRVMCSLYALLFFTLSFSSVGRFSFFVTSTLQTHRGVWFFPILMMGAVCFGAVKGLNGLLRAGSVLTVICVAAIVTIILSLIPRFDMLNILSPFYNGQGDFWQSLLLLTFSSMEMGLFLLLTPRVRGSVVKCYVGYALAAPVFLFLVFFTIIAVLGEYAQTQMFPFYGVSGMAGIGELTNLSALEASVWMIGVFLKSAVYLYLCYCCLSRMIPHRYRTLTLVLLAVLGVFCSVYSSENVTMAGESYGLPVIMGFNLLFVVVLPLIVWGIGLVKRRKSRERAMVCDS